MSDLYSIIEQWTRGYCVGATIPESFRRDASFWFDKVFKLCKEQSLANIIYSNDNIYRIHALQIDASCIIKYDNLYYSFSNDVDGLIQVARKDKFLQNDLIIIEYKPLNPINLNNLLDNMYVGYKSIYTSENEILSKLSRLNVVSIYYLKDGNDIYEYKKKGIKINTEDANLSYKDFVNKYNIEECV